MCSIIIQQVQEAQVYFMFLERNIISVTKPNIRLAVCQYLISTLQYLICLNPTILHQISGAPTTGNTLMITPNHLLITELIIIIAVNPE